MSDSLKQQSDAAREKILSTLKAAQKINDGSVSNRDRSVRVFPESKDLLSDFKDELTKIKGTTIEFGSRDELITLLKKLLTDRGWDSFYSRDPELLGLADSSLLISSEEDDFVAMEVGITQCEFLIARTGSVVVSSAQPSGRLMNIFPPVHIVLAKASQLVPFLDDAIEGVKMRYKDRMPSQVTVITGASRTADIEKTLVMGAHGPKEIIVLIEINA